MRRCGVDCARLPRSKWSKSGVPPVLDADDPDRRVRVHRSEEGREVPRALEHHPLPDQCPSERRSETGHGQNGQTVEMVKSRNGEKMRF